jgi:hypothetical protein
METLLNPQRRRNAVTVASMPNDFPEDRDASRCATPAAREYSRGYNPAPNRRHVRRNGEARDGNTPFITKSFTREEITHHPQVDVFTGEVHCDCEDFSFRLAPKARLNQQIPNITQPETCCKHILRAVENCRRHGELPEATPTPAPLPAVEEFEIVVLFDEECGDFWAYVNGQVEAMADTRAEAESQAQEYVARMKRQRRDAILSKSDDF